MTSRSFPLDVMTSVLTRIGVSVMFVSLAACASSTPPTDGARAEEGLPLTLENIYRQGRGGAGNPAISPDGRTVAFTGRGSGGSGIHRVAIDAGQAGEPVFWTEGSNPVWAPDGRSVLFTRGDRLWRLGLNDGEPKAITSAVKGLRAPAFSPDGSTIAFYSTEGGHQDIWLVPSEGGEARQLTRESMAVDDGRFRPAWSPDGRTIAYVSNKVDYWADDVWIVEVASGKARQLSRGVTVIAPSLYWSPGGDRLAVLGDSKKDYWYLDLTDIFLVDPKTGRESKVSMPIHATGYGNRAVWSGDGRRIYFIYQQRGEDYIWAVPADGGVATRVSHIGGVIGGFDATPDGSAFVFARGSATEGNDIYYLPAGGGPERRITNFATKWAGLHEPVEVSYRSYDGLYIQGFLYLPPGLDSGQRCPSLVQVHGGGSNSYQRGQNLMEQYFASKGFVVLAINYRGGSGFGREFQDLGVEDWLNGQALDPGAAADYLRTLPYGNGKVGIYGGSYGGMQSMAAITRTPDKFDAAAPMRGIYSQTMTFDLMDRLGKIFSKTGHGGLPAERPEIYAKSNTIDRFANIRVPLLITHGELDDRAPYRNFELAVAELKRLGKDFEAKSYPNEGHGFRNPDNSIDMYTRVEQFFRKHLGSCGG
ncbi:MAG TPA: S9 family peptidase [Vicinamibacterales bacterium]|nr:S9 family peptidase [Vicinamibacterales bacterium]